MRIRPLSLYKEPMHSSITSFPSSLTATHAVSLCSSLLLSFSWPPQCTPGNSGMINDGIHPMPRMCLVAGVRYSSFHSFITSLPANENALPQVLGPLRHFPAWDPERLCLPNDLLHCQPACDQLGHSRKVCHVCVAAVSHNNMCACLALVSNY